MDTLLNNPLVWLAPIASPLFAAFAVLVPRCRTLAENIAPWTALPALTLSLVPQATRSAEVTWLLLGSRLGLDDTARVFLFFTAMLWLASGLFASSYLAQQSRRYLFTFFFLLAMSGNLGLILAQDMPLFYVCFALMSFASYGLVVFNWDAEAIRAGRVYMVLVIVGELLLFSGLVVAASATGSILWYGLGDRLVDTPTGNAAMLLLFFGLAVKAGALPLHVWLPLAHPAAPVPASAVLSGAMIKAGLIGWLRLVPSDAAAVLPGWGELCLVLGVAAAFYGVAVGLAQANAKTVLAYSSISQMGLITVAVGLAFLSPGAPHAALVPTLMYAMHHGFAKGALFLGVGVASAARGVPWQRWLCGVGLLLPAFALAGMPLTSGAFAKAMLKSSAATAPRAWAETLGVLLPVAAVGTTLLMARFLWLTWPRPDPASKASPQHVWLPWVLLLVAVAAGVFLWPWGGDAVAEKVVFSSEKVVAALWPVIVGAVVAAAVAVASTLGFRFAVPAIPAGDLLVFSVAAAVAVSQGCRAMGRSIVSRFPQRYTFQGCGARASTRFVDLSHIVETALRRGVVFGVVLLVLVCTLISLIALPGSMWSAIMDQ